MQDSDSEASPPDTIEQALTSLRDRARAQLAANSYLSNPPVQGRLHTKSIAWRQQVSLAEPLKNHERVDLTMLVQQVDEWLTQLANEPGERTRAMIRAAYTFAEAYSRYSGSMMERINAPLVRQGLREEEADIRRSRNLSTERVIGQKELEAIARNVQAQFPSLKWSAQRRKIREIVNEQVKPKKLEDRTLREYLPAKKWNRRKKRPSR